jgi:hypothetical protein
MPNKPISKDQDIQDAEYQSDSEPEEILSSTETSDPPSLFPKTLSNAPGNKETASPRGANIFSNIKVNQTSRQKAGASVPSKRPIGFEFQAGPGGHKKATAAFRAVRDHDESSQAKDKFLEAR